MSLIFLIIVESIIHERFIANWTLRLWKMKFEVPLKFWVRLILSPSGQLVRLFYVLAYFRAIEMYLCGFLKVLISFVFVFDIEFFASMETTWKFAVYFILMQSNFLSALVFLFIVENTWSMHTCALCFCAIQFQLLETDKRKSCSIFFYIIYNFQFLQLALFW